MVPSLEILGTPPACAVAGEGSIDPEEDGEIDTWSGRARVHSTTGAVFGTLTHTTFEGDVFEGMVTFLRCRSDGGGGPGAPPAHANLSDWGGTGRWNGMPGYDFRVHADDRGEPGDRDFYSITVTDPELCSVVADPNDCLIYYAGGRLVAGNFQIFPVHP
jgi:hypothetical protein